MEELKSCPFCGVIPVMWEGREGWWVDCDNDSVCPTLPRNEKAYHKKEDAIKAWNTRA